MSKWSRYKNDTFKYWGLLCTVAMLGLLAAFAIKILSAGFARIDWDFISSLPSRKPELSGIKTALMGSIWVLSLTIIIAFPIGVASAIYLEEYARENKWGSLMEINISNLAGVPSVIYGLMGLEIFVRVFNFGESILAGALTLSLLILPVIVVASREAIRAVPPSIKEASYAMGASKWQTIWNQILPTSLGGILTGVILAISRAIGEAAPLIVVGAVAYVSFVPETIMDKYTVLPIQIFDWVKRPQAGFAINASAAIIILLTITFVMNGLAVVFRNRWQKKFK